MTLASDATDLREHLPGERLEDFRRQSLRRRIYRWTWGAGSRYRRNFRDIDDNALAKLREMLAREIVREGDADDLHEHLLGRLDEDRFSVVPWIDAAHALKGASILEIGSGTGASAVALGEQGAGIIGVDVDEASLAVARQRSAAYGVDASFHRINGADIAKAFPGASFDIVIFFAVLEHMTHEERIEAIRGTWEMVRPGGIWCVVETPNRLWFYDGHTSFENFYHWLPDQLAKSWGTRSRREMFSSALSSGTEMDHTEFARWGRGASYHEFDLALGDVRKLEVVSNKQDFLRSRNPALFAYSYVSQARKFERFLERLEPRVNPGFFRQYLDIAIRKA
jgi:2-polyprenyl-3-methyl-5-hydroxy-6-metoxy-1,4-benzoquinol methylase